MKQKVRKNETNQPLNQMSPERLKRQLRLNRYDNK